MYPYAFSPIIPDIYISEEDKYINDIKNLILFIDRTFHDTNFVKGLLLLIEMNIRKYNSNELAKQFLPIIENAIKFDQYTMIASAVLANNIDLFFNDFNLHSLDLLNTILNYQENNNNQIFNEWILRHLSQSSFI